jgi:2-polyprenyl-3-methyl-5-hydroxy-6-metoxy-1,4-benzoquinol methylase
MMEAKPIPGAGAIFEAMKSSVAAHVHFLVSQKSRERHRPSAFYSPMNSTPAPSLQLFFDTINAFQKTGALKAAIDLDLFTAIGQTSSTASEIAARCQCPERGIRILSDSLTIFGFLAKEDGRYSLTPDTAAFLDRSSRTYIGAAAEFFLSPGIVEGFSDLASTIRKGSVHQSELGTTAPDHPVWIKFARAMGPMMIPAAHGAAALVTLDPSRDCRILDIAASHAAYGIAMAERSPRAHLVALDWEAVLTVARENARAAGLGDRFSTIVGDAFTVDLGSGYDVVLVPNFLHHFNRADCVRFLRRVQAALVPGGRVVIVEFVPNDDRISPPPAASFSLVMLGTTPEGDAYTFAEYQSMLAEAGFREPALHPLPPTAESAVIAER